MSSATPLPTALAMRHVPGTGGVEQARAAEHRVRPEVQRVEVFVVDAPVDDVHGALALRRTHAHAVAAAGQVAPLDQLDPHQPGEQRVLEVGRVVDAGGEHDDDRFPYAWRRGRPQRGQQPRRVLVDRVHAVRGEEAGEELGHGPAVLDDVADAGGDAQVVLEGAEVPLLVADEIDTGDVHPHAVGRVDAERLAVEVRARGDHAAGHDAVGEDLAGAVDVGEERLEGADPLLHAGDDVVPLLGRDDPRQQVEREGLLLAGVREGDAPVGEDLAQLVGAEPQVGRAEGLQRRLHPVVRRPRLPDRREHLVPGARAPQRVVAEQGAHGRSLENPVFRRGYRTQGHLVPASVGICHLHSWGRGRARPRGSAADGLLARPPLDARSTSTFE